MNQMKKPPDLGHVTMNLGNSKLQRILKLILGTVVRLMSKKIRKVTRKKPFLVSPKTKQSPHQAWRRLIRWLRCTKQSLTKGKSIDITRGWKI